MGQAPPVEPPTPGSWCLIANVRDATKTFRFGTKLYCYPDQWGDGYRSIVVLGVNRRGRWVEACIKSTRLHAWRGLTVFQPKVLAHVGAYGNPVAGWRDRARERGLAVEALIKEYAIDLLARTRREPPST